MMDAERWHKVERVLDAVLDLSPDERTAYLDEECDDPAVRAEVEALIEAEANAPPFLDDAGDLAAPLLDDKMTEAPSSVSDRRVGPYHLLEEIGRGGMSVVYLAERADGHFKQQVALKLLPRYLETEDRIARFRAERQILASLKHPNIARLLDGGVTEEGRPYLAMEHVEGEPITDYCAAHDLSIKDRLALLRTVCATVQYAHQNLVVHRDLKPSNILVTGAGRVKLLDFGIAKLLDKSAAPVTMPITRTGERLLTPEYAAPEQITGGAITTATDVYQLGVLAYEMLTGQRPFRIEGRSLSDIEQAVVETPPTKPSTAITTRPADEPSSTAALPTRPGDWSRRLRGDLDTIVLKALRKEPERRYTSALELADDLQRYLDGRPVEARPATWRYRTKKFAQRHRWGVVVAAAVLMLITGTFAAVTHQRNTAMAERDRAEREAERAEREAQKAEQVSDFLMSLFEASAPDEARGETVTARQLLDLGIERAAGLDDQPSVQAQMFEVIGNIHRHYGDYERADDLLKRSVQMRRTLFDEAHPDLARSLRKLAELRKDEGAFAAADSLFRETIAMLRTLHGDAHPELATALSDRSILKSQQGAYGAAEALAREALSMRQALFSPPDEAIATSLNNLAAVHYRKGEYGEAVPLYEESLDMHRELLGADHPHVAALLNNLANLYHSMDRYEEAEAYRRDALALDRKIFGEDHRYVASDLVSLGSILSDKGAHAEAEALLRKAVNMQRSLLGETHPDVATAMDHLGIALSDQNRYEEAEAVLRDALRLRQEHFDDVHPRMVNTLNALGSVYKATSRYEQAVTHYREAVSIQRETVGSSGQKLARVLGNLARTLYELDDWTAAENAYRQALDIYRGSSSLDTLSIAEVHVGLGETLLHQDAFEDAESHLRTGRRLLEAAGREDHEATEQANAALTHLYPN